MRFRIRALAVALLIVGALVTPQARADTAQPIGPLVALRYNSAASDDHGVYHGSITVGDSIGGYATYRWGGSNCPNATLVGEELALLQRAMNNPRILIEPRTKLGQGGTNCLVAFGLVLRSDVGALP